MIEYILLFSLGFITAVLAGLLVAPAISRRIVHFTEKRVRATVPISSQELRARTDMIKAAYAAENAKLSQDVRHEREKGVANAIRAEGLAVDLMRVREDNGALAESLRSLQGDYDDLARQFQASQLELKAAQASLGVKQDALEARDRQLSELTMQSVHLGGLIDTGKIDLAARETEMETLRASLNVLRSERDKLREEVRQAEDRARHAEIRNEQDKGKIVNLQERLERELALNAGALPHNIEESKEPGSELDGTGGAIDGRDSANVAALPVGREIVIGQQRMADGLRHDAAALSSELSSEMGSEADERVRQEIASIAARMVALTATREGTASPLRSLLADREADGGHGRISLAERAARVLSGEDL